MNDSRRQRPSAQSRDPLSACAAESRWLDVTAKNGRIADRSTVRLSNRPEDRCCRDDDAAKRPDRDTPNSQTSKRPTMSQPGRENLRIDLQAALSSRMRQRRWQQLRADNVRAKRPRMHQSRRPKLRTDNRSALAAGMSLAGRSYARIDLRRSERPRMNKTGRKKLRIDLQHALCPRLRQSWRRKRGRGDTGLRKTL